VAGVAADAARDGGPARGSYTRQVKECLAVLAVFTGSPERHRPVGRRQGPAALYGVSRAVYGVRY